MLVLMKMLIEKKFYSNVSKLYIFSLHRTDIYSDASPRCWQEVGANKPIGFSAEPRIRTSHFPSSLQKRNFGMQLPKYCAAYGIFNDSMLL
jgi:hypothetical protein